MDWNDLKYLLAVARSGQAGLAAAQLQVSHATVSRKIAGLEKHYGVVLVDRSGLSWAITPVGHQIALLAEAIENHVNEANELVKEHGEAQTGTVRISAPRIVITELLSRALDGFAEQHPGINLDIAAQDDIVDLRAREADIALRFTHQPDPNLYGEKIKLFTWSFYARNDLCSKVEESVLADSGELPKVSLITSDAEGGFPGWAKGVFHDDCSLNHVYGFREKASLAARGLGVALLPDFIGGSENQIVRIKKLPCARTTQLWILTNADVKNSAKINTVKRFVVNNIEVN